MRRVAERVGAARRSARTTRSICMLGDVDHVGRGWPATGGCWLANGHPMATPTPTHAVLKPRRSGSHPIYLGEQPPQKQRDAGGGWMHDANTLYPANTVTEFGGIIENWKPAWLVLSFSLSSYRRIFWGTTNPPRFPFWVYSGVIWLNGYWSVGRTVRILENSREQVFGG